MTAVPRVAVTLARDLCLWLALLMFWSEVFQAILVAVTDCGKGWKLFPLRHILCSITASLRATATMARFLALLPPPAASFSPQRFRAESGPKRPRMYWADWTSRLRR